MTISRMLVNGMENPIGVDWQEPVFSFTADSPEPMAAAIYRENDTRPFLTRTVPFAERGGFRFDEPLEPGGFWRWEIVGGGTSASARLETGIPFSSVPFLTPADESMTAPVLSRVFFCPAYLSRARLFVTGLGLYRAELNGERVGDLYLTPGCNDYTDSLRYQTYDVTDLLRAGENNLLEISLGDGWYRGRYGIDKPKERGGNVFGTRYLAGLRLVMEDVGGGKRFLESDGKDWWARPSECTENSIYDGEIRDYTRNVSASCPCLVTEAPAKAVPQDTPPIRAKETRVPTLIRSPKGEQILDFGVNMVGFVRFRANLPKGTRVTLLHGELLQDGCFCRDNLRTAEAKAVYVSDGTERTYEPAFTYFGFRYVLVEGMSVSDPALFHGVVICTDLARVGFCETDREEINRLIANTLRGQMGNFLDLPTDCPQRDERLGWTADAQVFAPTACYQMNAKFFYRKYLDDLRADQTRYYQGDLPMYSPSLCGEAGAGGAGWADCGTILPMTLWQFYGDRNLLKRHYPMMQDYTETLIAKDVRAGSRHLLTSGFTFGDWLARDGICESSLKGGTEDAFLMSAYYFRSLSLTAEAASLLGYPDDAKRFYDLADAVKRAIQTEYFTATGRFALATQTAFFVVLAFGLSPDPAQTVEGLRLRLRQDLFRLKTGFLGTPLALPVLFENGLDEEAYRILFAKDGWLYAVRMGATTVWERWDSVLPDGHLSGTGMNSLNHYAYGSVCEAIYAFIAGLRQASPGWQTALIEPHPNRRLRRVSFRFDSPAGTYRVSWELRADGGFSLNAEIPAGCRALVRLPTETTPVAVEAGDHSFLCRPSERFLHPFGADTPILDLVEDAEAAEVLRRRLPEVFRRVTGENREFLVEPLRFFETLPMFGVPAGTVAALLRELRSGTGQKETVLT